MHVLKRSELELLRRIASGRVELRPTEDIDELLSMGLVHVTDAGSLLLTDLGQHRIAAAKRPPPKS
jgi:hypothetical protein